MGDPLQGNEKRVVDVNIPPFEVENVGIKDSVDTRIDPATKQEQITSNNHLQSIDDELVIANAELVEQTTELQGVNTKLGAISTIEDAPSVDGQQGIAFMAVRNDTGATLTSADGDESRIAVTKEGYVKIVSDPSQPVTVVVDTTSGPVEVTGTLQATQSGTWTVALDAATLAALEQTTVTVQGEVEVKNDAGNPLPVDIVEGGLTYSSDNGEKTVGTVSSVLVAASTPPELREVQIVVAPEKPDGTAQKGVHLKFGAGAATATNTHYPAGVYTFTTAQAISAIRVASATTDVTVGVTVGDK